MLRPRANLILEGQDLRRRTKPFPDSQYCYGNSTKCQKCSSGLDNVCVYVCVESLIRFLLIVRKDNNVQENTD